MQQFYFLIFMGEVRGGGGGAGEQEKNLWWRWGLWTIYQIPQAALQPNTKWTVPHEGIFSRNNQNKGKFI